MKKILTALTISLLSCNLWAENISGETDFLCSTSHAFVCVEDGECFDVPPRDLQIPQFVIIDTRKKTVSTTQASGEKRTTSVSEIDRLDGRIFMQGVERGRAFSFVIEEDSGVLTAAIAHHGLTVSVFGACTSAEIE